MFSLFEIKIHNIFFNSIPIKPLKTKDVIFMTYQ